MTARRPAARFARRVVLGFFRHAARMDFREFEVAFPPSEPTPGRMFAANHVNGLVDPIVLLTSMPCDAAPIATPFVTGSARHACAVNAGFFQRREGTAHREREHVRRAIVEVA